MSFENSSPASKKITAMILSIIPTIVHDVPSLQSTGINNLRNNEVINTVTCRTWKLIQRVFTVQQWKQLSNFLNFSTNNLGNINMLQLEVDYSAFIACGQNNVNYLVHFENTNDERYKTTTVHCHKKTGYTYVTLVVCTAKAAELTNMVNNNK